MTSIQKHAHTTVLLASIVLVISILASCGLLPPEVPQDSNGNGGTHGPKATVSFATSADSVAESVSSYNVTLALSNAVADPVLLTLALESSSTTATSGIDFTTSSLSVLIPAGSVSAAFSLQIINDLAIEEDETVVLSIASALGADISGIVEHTLTIENDDVPTPSDLATLHFAEAVSNIGEADGSISIGIELTPKGAALTDAVEFDLSISTTSTAVVDTDFTLSQSHWIFGAGVTSLSIPFSIIDDVDFEPSEHIVLALSPVTAGINLADPWIHTIYIADNDVTPEVRVGFVVTESNAGEEAGTHGVELELSYVGMSHLPGDVTVEIAVVAADGMAGVDFTMPPSRIVTFDAQDASDEWTKSGATATFSIDILPDTEVEADEIITLQLLTSAASQTTVLLLPQPATHTITIKSDDLSREMRFVSPANIFEVAEDSGDVAIEVEMTLYGEDELSEPVVCDLSVDQAGNNLATQGSDYTLSAVQFIFPVGSKSGDRQSVILSRNAWMTCRTSLG